MYTEIHEDIYRKLITTRAEIQSSTVWALAATNYPGSCPTAYPCRKCCAHLPASELHSGPHLGGGGQAWKHRIKVTESEAGVSGSSLLTVSFSGAIILSHPPHWPSCRKVKLACSSFLPSHPKSSAFCGVKKLKAEPSSNRNMTEYGSQSKVFSQSKDIAWSLSASQP